MHRAPRRAAALPKRTAHHSVDMELQMLGTRVGGAARRGAPPSWMLAIIVALVMRRNRANQGRLLVQDAGPEDQEHLVKMQKNGYENPTYKFFYY